VNGVHNMSSVWARHRHVGLHFWQSFQYLNGLWGTCTCVWHVYMVSSLTFTFLFFILFLILTEEFIFLT
jgi:hypothetical protein